MQPGISYDVRLFFVHQTTGGCSVFFGNSATIVDHQKS